MISSEEMNYVKYNAELALLQYASRSAADNATRSENTESLDDDLESEVAMLCKPNIAGTLVLESTTADVDNVPIDCCEELVHNSNVDDTMVTAYCKKSSICHDSNGMMYSEEETGTNTDEDYDPQRSSQQSTGFTVNEVMPPRDVRAFNSDDDKTSHDNSMFRILSHNRENTKPIIFGSSELADPHCESDRPHKPQDHQLTLPFPIVVTSTSNLVKPRAVTGNCFLYHVSCDEKVYLSKKPCFIVTCQYFGTWFKNGKI